MIPDSRLCLQIVNYMVCANFDYTAFLPAFHAHVYTQFIGKTALHFAVDQEHEDIVELLLEANADPDLAEVITLTNTVYSLQKIIHCNPLHGKFVQSESTINTLGQDGITDYQVFLLLLTMYQYCV